MPFTAKICCRSAPKTQTQNGKCEFDYVLFYMGFFFFFFFFWTALLELHYPSGLAAATVVIRQLLRADADSTESMLA